MPAAFKNRSGKPVLDQGKMSSQQMDELRLNLSLALPHELRTPLSVILGFSEFLVSRGPERLPEAETILNIQTSIYDNALRLQHLIENYLLYAHLKLLEQDPEKRHREMWESDELIHARSLLESVARFKARKARRQNDLRFSTTDDVILRISSKSLHKILEELLDNAFKFSEPGTPVHVMIERSGAQWLLKIADQGRGMTPEQIANIGAFMQFERLRYEQQGSGLGLTIALLLTRLNRGELTIESLPNQGTTITVMFNHEMIATSP